MNGKGSSYRKTNKPVYDSNYEWIFKSSTMTETEFLHWIAARFVNVIGEKENCDFVLRLKALAELLKLSNIEELKSKL